MSIFSLLLKESIIRRFFARSEWSDTFELLGWIFLLIILYAVGCEVIRYGFILFRSIPKDVSFEHIEHKS